MSAPFAPGDVVECVDARKPSWHEPKDHPLALGDVFRVRRFVRGIPFGLAFPRSFVVFGGRENAILHWDAYRFRKVEPQLTADFRAQLKSLSTPKERVET